MDLATPTGIEPVISCVTGKRLRPLDYGANVVSDLIKGLMSSRSGDRDVVGSLPYLKRNWRLHLSS